MNQIRSYADTDDQCVAAFEDYITHAATTAESVDRRKRQVAHCAEIHAQGYFKRQAVDCHSSGTRCCGDLAGDQGQ